MSSTKIQALSWPEKRKSENFETEIPEIHSRGNLDGKKGAAKNNDQIGC